VVTKGTSDSTHLTVVYGTNNASRGAKTGQATKGTRWMPRHQETMKDVETCEKPRGAGLERRSVDIRMGKPGGRHGPSSHAEYIGMRGQRGELKHLSTPRKGNQQRLRK
jgi:hypothetical protein